jgi:hypothetical protein
MTRIGLLGDTHGNANVVLAALRNFFAADVMQIIQVGDFGFWPGKHGVAFLTYVNTLLAKNNQTLYVIPGNHEDYTQIRFFMEREDGWLEAKSHILVAPRGFRWEWDGVSFVALGGAPSVDRGWRVHEQRRTGYPIWWAEEAITGEDMEKTMAGGRADVMVAHDAPLGVPQIEKRIANNPHGFWEADLEYALQGRVDMAAVVDVVRPKLFFHGHYHFKVDDKLEIFNEDTGLDDVVAVKGLASDGQVASSGILDLDTLKFSFLPH